MGLLCSTLLCCFYIGCSFTKFIRAIKSKLHSPCDETTKEHRRGKWLALPSYSRVTRPPLQINVEMRKKSEVHGLHELVPAVRRIYDEGPCNLSSGLNLVHIVLGFTFNMCEDVSNVKFKAENKYEEMQQLRIPHLIRYRAVTTCAPACLSATCTPLFRSFLLQLSSLFQSLQSFAV